MTSEPAQSDIVVTGSRVARQGYLAPTPTTVLSIGELQNRGTPNIAETLNTLPTLRATLSPSANPGQSNSAGGNFLDLRGLGANRTLLLVDGKRFVSSLSEGPVDINAIPQALIDNVDVVTGGASAAYGSDAVAGVVNIRLDHKLEGVRGSVQGGITDHNDHRNYRVSLAAGHSFAEDRGKILLAGEIAQNSGVLSIYDRGWGARERGVVANPAYTATNAEPRNLLVDHALRANTSYGGVINAGPLAGIQFAPDGSAIPFRYGSLVTTRTMIGGDGAYSDAKALIETPNKRRSLYGRLSYEFSPALSLYGEVSWAESRSRTLSTTREDTAVTVRSDNPFLPQSIRTAMAVRNLASFTLGRFSADYGNTIYNIRNRTARGVIGAEGQIGGGWSWDAYYTHGESNVLRAGLNNRITANYGFAVDATTDPLTGAAVCRNVAARAAGCVPLNIFGNGAPSPQALGYITTDDSFRLSKLRQDAGAIAVRGDLFSTWAGPISSAAGFEYRRESTAVTVDPLSAAFALATGTSAPYRGSVNVKEVFAEAVVPLAEDMRWAQAIDLNLAARLTDYSRSGTVTTWKAGATWNVNDVLRFRGTYSKDIRAPSLYELYLGLRSSRGDAFDPLLNQTYQVQTNTQGNLGLKPERSKTVTAGVILTNPLISGLNLSVDYYDINIKGAIGSLTAVDILNRCYLDRPELCSLVQRGANGMVTIVTASPQNFSSVQVRGVDFEAGYRSNLAGGSIALRVIASYLDRIGYNDGRNVTRLEGSLTSPFEIGANGQPRWRAVTSLTYQREALTFFAETRLIGGARLNNLYTAKDYSKLKVPAIAYLDLSAKYALFSNGSNTAELFFSVQNLLDQDPPQTEDVRGVNGQVYDLIGRTYQAGMRFKF